MRCPECDKIVPLDAKYCSNCGAFIKISEPYLAEKIAEARSNELIAFLLMIPAFIIIFCGFYLATIRQAKTEWTGGGMYTVTYHPYVDVAIMIVVVGVVSVVGAVVIRWYYSSKKSQYAKQLESLKQLTSLT